MKAFGAVLLCTLQTVFGAALPAFSLQKTDLSILRRQTRSIDGNIGCSHMASFPGELHYVSDGTEEVCGLYLIGQPNQIIEVAFLEFNVNCETGGLLALFDGWELEGGVFPGVNDHANDLAERYTQFCGEQQPTVFMSAQNVALIQFLIPQPGEGFKVIVNFKRNPQPCNAVAMFETGVLTMRNYGLRRNCSISIIYPEQINLVNVDVGVSSQSQQIEAEVGLSNQQCMNYAGGDYIQVMNGNGLDPSMMTTRGVVCGMDSNSDAHAKYVLGCQHSAVRMVSSGDFHNTVTFQYTPPRAEDLQTSDMC